MGYKPNPNCIYNDRGAWCTNKNIKKSLFGLGARCCVEFYDCADCIHKVGHKRPTAPPPPPKPPSDNSGLGIACGKCGGVWGECEHSKDY